MYSVKQKEIIIKRIKNGTNISEISAETDIPEEVLEEWKRKEEIKAIIDELIEKKQFEEAKYRAEELTQGSSEATKLSIFARIAKGEKDRVKERELLERQLKLEPDNVKVISSLIRIAREEENLATSEGDTKREGECRLIQKKLLERSLQIEPDNVIGISNLARIAREEGDTQREKELLERQIQINKKDIRAMSSLIRIAREEEEIADAEGNIEKKKVARARKKELLEMQLEAEPEKENIRAIINLIRIAREEGDTQREKELLERKVQIIPNDVRAISRLLVILRQEEKLATAEGDTEKEEECRLKQKELLEEQLQIEPDNVKAINSLIIIAGKEEELAAKEKDKKRKQEARARRKKLLERLLQLQPKDIEIMLKLVKIAQIERDIVRERELLEEILQIDPSNKFAKKNLKWCKKRESRMGIESKELDQIYINQQSRQELEARMMREVEDSTDTRSYSCKKNDI